MHETTLLQAWEAALAATRALSPATFDRWFSGVQLESLTDGVLCLRARDAFHRDWVCDHYLPSVVEHLRAATGLSIQLAWTLGAIDRPLGRVADEAPSSRPRVRASVPPPPSTPSVRARPAQPAAPSPAEPPEGLNQKYTFANFVVGPSNQLAHAAALAAAGGGGRRYSPLFLCGGTGLGKTHLMQAIAHDVRASGPDKRIVYVSAERFTNEFISAIQHKKMDAFRERYRGQCDILLVDDVQFLAGREQTQEEFFHTFNALHEKDRPIVVTSDKYPQALERMEERLVSRFSWGLVADIQVPELETRVAIVRKKADAEGLTLPADVALFLAQTVHANVRELEGTLVRLAVKASLTARPIDLAFVEAELSQVQGVKRVTSLDDIQRAVCHQFQVRSSDLVSHDRHRSVALARHVAMYLAKMRLGVSFPELGRAFGKDHTTVMSAVRKVGELRRTDQLVRAHLDAIEKRLANDK